MAYHYRRHEPVSRGTRRIVRERLTKAIEQLDLDGERLHEGIHEARKRFKEIRAVLRLARAGLGDRYHVENRWYRDAGRALAEARNAQAAVETWEKLRSRFPDLCNQRGAADVARQLEASLRSAGAGEKSVRAPRDSVREALPAAYERITRWPVRGAGFEALREGAKRIYRQGRRSMREAYASDDALQFHEWRKRAKDLWYHTRLLGPIWRDEMKLRAIRLEELSDTLGDDHDLVVFTQLVQDRPRMFGPRDFRTELSSCIALRQQELRADAYRLGQLLYAERPESYVSRIEAYWRLWRPLSMR